MCMFSSGQKCVSIFFEIIEINEIFKKMKKSCLLPLFFFDFGV